MTDKLSNIVLFGGDLKELNDFTGKQYEIAGEYFESKPYSAFSDLGEECRKELKNEGYDGIIRRRTLHLILFGFSFSEYITGVPVKLIEGEK